jgi:hypothetical protein
VDRRSITQRPISIVSSSRYFVMHCTDISYHHPPPTPFLRELTGCMQFLAGWQVFKTGCAAGPRENFAMGAGGCRAREMEVDETGGEEWMPLRP